MSPRLPVPVSPRLRVPASPGPPSPLLRTPGGWARSTGSLRSNQVEKFADANGIRLRYLDRAGNAPVLVLLPGLTANSHSFDGLMKAGLSPRFRTIAIDLRGRGLTDKPAAGYSMQDHAEDVVGLLKEISVNKVVLCGHSFGGMLAIYISAKFPELVDKLVLLDAATDLVNEGSLEAIKPSLDRLGRRFNSWEEYLSLIKSSPFFDSWWDLSIESYYKADVEIADDGSVRQRSNRENILEAATRTMEEDWDAHVKAVKQPVLLLHAAGRVGLAGTGPLVSLTSAESTCEALSNCKYVEVSGNHFTMLYGEAAETIVREISHFAS